MTFCIIIKAHTTKFVNNKRKQFEFFIYYVPFYKQIKKIFIFLYFQQDF